MKNDSKDIGHNQSELFHLTNSIKLRIIRIIATNNIPSHWGLENDYPGIFQKLLIMDGMVISISYLICAWFEGDFEGFFDDNGTLKPELLAFI